MKLNVVDIKGKKIGIMSASDEVWGAEANPALVAQAVRVYRSNLRQGGAATKNRGGINRSGRKMWKQKGTGRARHGDRTAPQFVGGAKAHGPTGQENYKLRLNQKMKQGALESTLSDKVRDNRATVVESLPEVKKTKILSRLLGVLTAGSKLLLVVDKPSEDLILAARNLEGVTLARPEELNVLTVLGHQRLVVTKEAVKHIGKVGWHQLKSANIR